VGKLIILILIISGGWYVFNNYLKPAGIKPKDSDSPAAGICDYQEGDTVTITLNGDIPSPRCVKVKSNQNLRVQNNTEGVVTVWFDNVSSAVLFPYSIDIRPDNKYIFATPFGEYLKPGVHKLKTSLYKSSGPEIWLVE